MRHSVTFFCGIGGTGMSGLATLLARRGVRVRGSDRSFDQGTNPDIADALRRLGIELAPQDGSGIDESVDTLVVSSAIEPTIPDVRAATKRGIRIIRRADLLAQIFATGPAIAIGGTSGKTTVTAMTGHILRETGHDPTVINGGIMLNSRPDDGLGNAWPGRENLCVIEADESDGTIELYTPDVAVLTTVSLDHRPLDELRTLFTDFVSRARVAPVANVDNDEVRQIAKSVCGIRTVGINSADADLRAAAIEPKPNGIAFMLDNTRGGLAVPGRHNVINALMATAACNVLGVPVSAAIDVLRTFRGTHRRLEVVGCAKGNVTVIDDFAHNPEKIHASLSTLKEFPGPVAVFYQPHGFRPTEMLRDGLVAAFRQWLDADDLLLMPEIYYAGGTAPRTISSRDLVADLIHAGKNARFVESRDAALEALTQWTAPGSRVVVMGARDATLAGFAHGIARALA